MNKMYLTIGGLSAAVATTVTFFAMRKWAEHELEKEVDEVRHAWDSIVSNLKQGKEDLEVAYQELRDDYSQLKDQYATLKAIAKKNGIQFIELSGENVDNLENEATAPDESSKAYDEENGYPEDDPEMEEMRERYRTSREEFDDSERDTAKTIAQDVMGYGNNFNPEYAELVDDKPETPGEMLNKSKKKKRKGEPSRKVNKEGKKMAYENSAPVDEDGNPDTSGIDEYNDETDAIMFENREYPAPYVITDKQYYNENTEWEKRDAIFFIEDERFIDSYGNMTSGEDAVLIFGREAFDILLGGEYTETVLYVRDQANEADYEISILNKYDPDANE